ncbi:MAG: hypothetical protein HY763_05615 [Planctomycetes bacterium]|nr:hypothetical protein [Planctomycetota bacterium]
MFTPLKLISVLVCIALVVGYTLRRRPRVHIPLMLTAFVVDLALVLYLEITRDAIGIARQHLGPLMIVHIAISVAVLALYVGQIATGLRKVRGRPSAWHGRAGLVLLVARLANLVTSFLVTA